MSRGEQQKFSFLLTRQRFFVKKRAGQMLGLEYDSSSSSSDSDCDNPPQKKRIKSEEKTDVLETSSVGLAPTRQGGKSGLLATTKERKEKNETLNMCKQTDSTGPRLTQSLLPSAADLLSGNARQPIRGAATKAELHRRLAGANLPVSKVHNSFTPARGALLMVPPQMRRPNISTEEKSLWSTDKTMRASQKKPSTVKTVSRRAT